MALKTPNYYQASNELVDHYLPKLSGPEAKVMMFLERKIIGFHKQADRDYISVRQIMKGTGINSRDAVAQALKHLRELGLTAIRQPGKGKKQQITILFEKEEMPEKPESKGQKVSCTAGHCVPPGGTPGVPYSGTTKESLLKKSLTKQRDGCLAQTYNKENYVGRKGNNPLKQCLPQTYNKENPPLTPLELDSYKLMVNTGMKPKTAYKFAQQHDPQTITEVIEGVSQSSGVRNPQGLIVDRLNTIKETSDRERETELKQQQAELQAQRERQKQYQEMEKQKEEEIAEFHQWQQSHPNGTYTEWVLATTQSSD